MTKRAHSLHRLLPVLLLALFLLLGGLSVLLTASAYRGILGRSRQLDRSTALTYITEKVRQNDTAGALRLGELGGCQALVIRQGEEILYDTYIYCHDGSLRELMIKQELEPDPELGRRLLAMEALSFTLEEGLLRIRCTDPDGQVLERSVAVRSGEVAP